jgi:hypothetical protein
MKMTLRMVIPFVTGMIYIQSGFSDIVITGFQPFDWMILGAIAGIPSYIFYGVTENE